MRRIAVLHDNGDFVTVGWVIGYTQLGIQPSLNMWLWPSWCCKPSPLRVVRPAVAPTKKATGLAVARCPRQVTNALEPEH